MYTVRYKILPADVKEARRLAPNGAYNSRSITNGERNLLGILGELCYVKMMRAICPEADIDHTPTMNYDVVINGRKVDVKTKQRSVAPRAEFAASIVAYSRETQHCEVYEFTSITVNNKLPDSDDRKFSEFFYIGARTKKNYFKNSKFMKKGEPEGNNYVPTKGREFRIVEDCYNMPYSELIHMPESILDEMESREFTPYRL